jgi:thiol-disulfide isomerase/thioredoxin
LTSSGGGELNTKEAEPPLFLGRAAKYVAVAVLAASAGIAAAMLFPGMTDKLKAFRAAYLQDPVSRFTRHAEPQIVPDIAFNDADGRQVRLSDWGGQLVLLNLWATWCGPCKTEMPSLDRLQAKLGGREFTVLALSTDRGGPKLPAQFFSKEGITHLKVFNDNTGQAAIHMKGPGLPLSIVLNEKGLEIARLFGPMEWDTPEMLAQFEAWKSPDANGRGTTRPSL